MGGNEYSLLMWRRLELTVVLTMMLMLMMLFDWYLKCYICNDQCQRNGAYLSILSSALSFGGERYTKGELFFGLKLTYFEGVFCCLCRCCFRWLLRCRYW